jgi:hypothetical protein
MEPAVMNSKRSQAYLPDIDPSIALAQVARSEIEHQIAIRNVVDDTAVQPGEARQTGSIVALRKRAASLFASLLP